MSMKRRGFIALLGGAAASLPFSASAQQSKALRTVGVLMTVAENDPDSQTRIAAFRRGFADLGIEQQLLGSVKMRLKHALELGIRARYHLRGGGREQEGAR